MRSREYALATSILLAFGTLTGCGQCDAAPQYNFHPAAGSTDVVQKITLVQGDSTQVSLDISGCGFDHTATWSVDDATVIDMKTTTNSNPRAARVKGLRVGMATVTVKLVGYEGFPAMLGVEVRAP